MSSFASSQDGLANDDSSPAFITPLFQTFYYIQVSILYTLLSSIQGFTAEKYGELPIEHLEDMYNDRLGDAAERLAELGLTKRFVGTGQLSPLSTSPAATDEMPPARLMSAHRQGSSDSASVASSSYVPTSRPPPPSSSGSYSSSAPTKAPYRSSLPPAAPAASYEPAPPPYIPSTISPAPTGAKRAPPPPPAPKPRPAAPKPKLVYVTALYDYAATAEGDLSFSAGDRIELIKRGESAEDWWTGRLEAGGEEGVFPGTFFPILVASLLTDSHDRELRTSLSCRAKVDIVGCDCWNKGSVRLAAILSRVES